MGDPSETWSERFERELIAVRALLRRKPLVGIIFLCFLAIYGCFQLPFFKDAKGTDPVVAPPPPPKLDGSVSNLPLNATGWMYVGSRINDAWKTSEADGIEPALTLITSSIPSPSRYYRTAHSVRVREGPPILSPYGGRPTMAPALGALQPGSLVKVDAIKNVDVYEGGHRTWIWAHITVVARPNNE